MKLSRRQFIRFIGNSALFLTVFVAADQLSGAKAYGAVLRPPGAVDEESFLATCIRCGMCVDVCRLRTRVLKTQTLARGYRNAGLPWFASPESYCKRCLKCVEACPTGALREVPPKRLGIGTGQIIKERCRAYQGRECNICALYCKIGGTIMVDGVPVVQEDVCDGAGLCVLECPDGARYVKVDPKKRQKSQ